TVHYSDGTGTPRATEEVVFDFRESRDLSLQITSPVFDVEAETHVLPEITVTGQVSFDSAWPLQLLQLEVEREDDAGSGEAATYDLLTDETWDLANGTFNISLPLQQIGTGDYVLRVVSADVQARTASAEVAFTYREAEAPVITADPVPANVVGDLTVSGSVSWDPLLGSQGVEQVWADLYFASEVPQLLAERIPLNLNGAEFAA